MPPKKKKREIVYSLQIDSRVAKDLRHIPMTEQERILAAMEALTVNPKPVGAKKLTNQPGWRIRIGDYRVLYEIIDSQGLIRIYRAGHRRDIYR